MKSKFGTYSAMGDLMSRMNVSFVRTSKPLRHAYTVALALVLILPTLTRAQNTGYGTGALAQNTSGYWNSAFGYDALYANETGIGNTGSGYLALYSNQNGTGNTAIGGKALYSNVANYNTATGYGALYSNYTGWANVADGFKALLSDTTGDNNTAEGYQALYSTTTGGSNTAEGSGALYYNNGNLNTATGASALYSNQSGGYNTAIGSGSLYINTAGNYNTAIGSGALTYNQSGSSNVALGFNAGYNLTTGNNNIDIGNLGAAGDNDTIKIGVQGTQTATYIAGIHGATIAGGVEVVVDASGQVGTRTSSARFKEAIKPMAEASEAILALKPVTFHYKKELDPQGIAQFGLVAEQVEKVNPDLVVRDQKGQIYSVRYEAVNAMLLNEFLKEHQRVQDLQGRVDQMAAQMKEQASVIEEVSKKVEARELSTPELARYQVVPSGITIK
jgi:Chaperone of endosialidase